MYWTYRTRSKSGLFEILPMSPSLSLSPSQKIETFYSFYIKETEINANHASIISRATSNDRGIYCIIFNTDLLYKCRQKRVKYSKSGVEKTSQPQMLIQKKLKKNEYPPPSCPSLTPSLAQHIIANKDL
jgi:hypothetical protein